MFAAFVFKMHIRKRIQGILYPVFRTKVLMVFKNNTSSSHKILLIWAEAKEHNFTLQPVTRDLIGLISKIQRFCKTHFVNPIPFPLIQIKNAS